MSDIIRVSHSQLSEWRRCRFSWGLSYIGKWKPIKTAYPLRLGSIVHKMLANYYEGVIEGVTDAIGAHQDFLRVLANDLLNPDDLQAVAHAGKLVERYITEFAIYEDSSFIPVDVEKHYVTELETPKGRPFEFELYFDLLFMQKGNGKLWMVDHKTHNSRPFSDTDIMMDPQLPAYAMVMREKFGVEIFGLMYNMLNTYDYKNPAPSDKLFLRKKTYRTPEELDSTVKEIGATVDDIIDNQDNLLRNLTRDCSWCKFQDPCLMGMKGMDILPILEDGFQKKEPRPDAEEEASVPSRYSL